MGERVVLWLSETGLWRDCPEPWRNMLKNLEETEPHWQADGAQQRRLKISKVLARYNGVYHPRKGPSRPQGFVEWPDQESLTAWTLAYT